MRTLPRGEKISKGFEIGKIEAMLPNYDFSHGVRGKHYKKFREGVTFQLIGENVNARVEMLDDAKDFPDSKSVSNALRHLAKAMPKAKTS